jgi:hypothetical protein
MKGERPSLSYFFRLVLLEHREAVMRKKAEVGPRLNDDSQPGPAAESITERQQTAPAIDAMRQAAANVLREKCSPIANGMAEKAAQGDVRCARFLCDLANEDKELTLAQEKRVKRSLATEWANEPEWTSDLEEKPVDILEQRIT